MNSKKVNLKAIAINLLYLLIAYLPFNSLLSVWIPIAGWIKDILCIMIVFICIFACGKLRVNRGFISVLIYTLLVVFSLLINGKLSLGEKIDAFRYRNEYAITLCVLFSSFRYTKKELVEMASKFLKILYYTGIVVAIIGIVEMINPSLVHSIYGSRLTAHLYIYSAGVSNVRLISTMGNPINLGLQMNLAILAAIYLYYEPSSNMNTKNGRLGKYANWIAILLFCIVEIFTYSRTAYIITVFIFIAFYFVRIFVSKIEIRKKVFSVLLLFVILIAFFLLINSNESFAARFYTMNLETFSENIRFERAYSAFISSGFNIFNVLFGYGAGSSLGEGGQYVFEFGYASLLYETGIISVLVFLNVLLHSFNIGAKLIRSESKKNSIVVPFITFLVGFMIGMATEDVYFQLPFSLYFWLSVFVLFTLHLASHKDE